MATPVEYGSVRQVWVAKYASPTVRTPLLIRDDAYSEREASGGRTVRLGDPVRLGPTASWRQANWSGGMDQDRWRDEAMFTAGSADTSERRGLVKLWNGFTGIAARANDAENRYVAVMANGARGSGEDTPLLFAESTGLGATGGGGNPRIFQYTLGGGAPVILTSDSGVPRAMGLIANDETDDSTGHMLVGFANGTLKKLNHNTGAWTNEPTPPGPGAIGWNTIVPYNYATYFFRGNRLIRRVPAFPAKYSTVKRMTEITHCRGMLVWNNRLWFVGEKSGGRTGLYVSDGVTVQEAFEMPGVQRAENLCVHYGSLYIRTAVDVAGGGLPSRQQIWRYNGSSLTMLWEEPEPGRAWQGGLVSWGRFLAWPKHGDVTLGMEAGVYLYDAEEDAIMLGPTIPVTGGASRFLVTAIGVWNNTLVAAWKDMSAPYGGGSVNRPWYVAHLEKERRYQRIKLDGTLTTDIDRVSDTRNNSQVFDQNVSFRSVANRSNKTQAVLSSSYDGGLPEERKVWLRCHVRARVPQQCRVTVKVLLDDSATEHTVAVINGAAAAEWQSRSVQMLCQEHNMYHVANSVRYKLYVENFDLQNQSTRTPEVDVVGFDFQAAADAGTYRSQFHLRVLAADGQTTLDGTPNPKTTRAALVDTLRDFWKLRHPFWFWPPRADGSEPTSTDDAVLVLASGFVDQSYRVDTEDDQQISEVSLDLLEVS